MRIVKVVENSFSSSQLVDYRPREFGAAGFQLIPMSYTTHVMQVHLLDAAAAFDRQLFQCFWNADLDTRPIQGACPTDRFRVRHLTGATGDETLIFYDEPLPWQWIVPVDIADASIAFGATSTRHTIAGHGIHDYWFVSAAADSAFTILVTQSVGGEDIADAPVASWAGPGAGGAVAAIPNFGSITIKVRNDDGGAAIQCTSHVMGVKGTHKLPGA